MHSAMQSTLTRRRSVDMLLALARTLTVGALCPPRLATRAAAPRCAASLAAVERRTVELATGLEMEWLRAGAEQPSDGPPVLFVHGTFHGAWCWAEHWMSRFAAANIDCHAVSLRGTSGSPSEGATVKLSLIHI